MLIHKILSNWDLTNYAIKSGQNTNVFLMEIFLLMTYNIHMTYENCPKYGQPDCCGTWFKDTIERMSKFSIMLKVKDGSLVEFHPWIISEFEEHSNVWTALRLKNPDIGVDITDLTKESQKLLARHYHSGVVKVYKTRTCPFFR
jgi:hypothetical protein